MDIDGYSARAEAFATELARRHYRHFAGIGADAPGELYERSARLFTAEAVERLRDAAGVAARGPAPARGGAAGVAAVRPGDAAGLAPPGRAAARDGAARRARMLLRFAVDGHLARATSALEAELAHHEATERVVVRGVPPLRLGDVAAAQAAEPDAERRAALEAERCRVTAESLAPIALEITQARHAGARALGWPSYAAMYADVHGVDLVALAAQAGRFLAATDAAFDEVVGPAVRLTLGGDLTGLRRGDLPRLFRDPALDRHFPADGLTAALARALADLGIDLAAQPGIVLDLAPRATKSRRAFCAPVRVPQEVYLVLAAAGGREDYAALLHEAGHAEHFAAADPALPFELRRFGDPALGEAFAFLLERITDQPAWLRDRGVDEGRGATTARARRLLLLRRYAAKLRYELELHDGTVAPAHAAERYAAHLSRALRVAWPAATWLTDLDPGLYVAHYLRAWALEARLRAALGERFGPEWFRAGPGRAGAGAGDELRAWWRLGHGPQAEELLADLGLGTTLDFSDLAAEFAVGEPAPAPGRR